MKIVFTQDIGSTFNESHREPRHPVRMNGRAILRQALAILAIVQREAYPRVEHLSNGVLTDGACPSAAEDMQADVRPAGWRSCQTSGWPVGGGGGGLACLERVRDGGSSRAAVMSAASATRELADVGAGGAGEGGVDGRRSKLGIGLAEAVLLP